MSIRVLYTDEFVRIPEYEEIPISIPCAPVARVEQLGIPPRRGGIAYEE
ncbi:MAG: hypothetical protein M3N32_07485 [Actinomycetota bacterium]|nr:hypothetical protein [Actinomycetota bacterium]